MLMHNQETVSEVESPRSGTENSNPKVINVASNIQQVMALTSRGVDTRESELSHVAVLAYD